MARVPPEVKPPASPAASSPIQGEVSVLGVLASLWNFQLTNVY